MAKQSNQKLKLLYLLKILFEQTDEQSGLTIAQISAELAKYNVSAARKSLYDDIELLRVFGVDVQVKRDRYVKYYIASRDVSVAELRYIIDAIGHFDALAPSVGYELAQKMIRLYSVKGSVFADALEEPIYQTPRSVFGELAKSVELLQEAIAKRKRIRCRQFTWNSHKQRTLKDNGAYICLTPIRLACEEKYILYAYDGRTIVTLYADELIDLEILSEDAEPIDSYRELLADPRYNVTYENLRLECDNSFAGDVFLKFGLGVTVLANREECFEISLKTRLDDDFYSWLFCNAKHVRIISPTRVLEDYKQHLLLALDNLERG